MFCSRLGRRVDGSALRRRFKRATAAAGLRVLRFHALRHGAGSMVARQGDPRWVQAFLGHSKLTTTERSLRAKAPPQDVDLLNRAFAPSVLSDGGADLQDNALSRRAAGRGT
ncbi:MAG: tyrosine-type recombinase/integrase [Solirubrobacteraceae bacterium]